MPGKPLAVSGPIRAGPLSPSARAAHSHRIVLSLETLIELAAPLRNGRSLEFRSAQHRGIHAPLRSDAATRRRPNSEGDLQDVRIEIRPARHDHVRSPVVAGPAVFRNRSRSPYLRSLRVPVRRLKIAKIGRFRLNKRNREFESPPLRQRVWLLRQSPGNSAKWPPLWPV